MPLYHCLRPMGVRFLLVSGVVGCVLGIGGAVGRHGPAFFVEGEAVDFEAIAPALAEAAGGRVIEEVVLDRLLEAECTRAGIVVGREQIDAERDRLEASLSGVGADRERVGEMVRAVRASRGLGDVRYGGLLRRNAMLRALVADRVEIDEEQIEVRYRIVYGPKVVLRTIVVPTLGQAQGLVERLRGEDGPVWARFAALALEHSTDPTASRGGLLEPLSLEDPAYPAGMRRAVEGLEIGGVTDPVAVEGGYALFLLEGRVAARDVPLERVRVEVERELRLRQERILMEQLAAVLIERARVRVVDPHLEWSWRAWRRQGVR